MGGAAVDVLSELVSHLPAGGEVRPGQLAMTEAVEEALALGRHLVAQAGTGTGKSLAYLVPAILSGRTVVVATATKALQDQLAEKDLPFIARHLDTPFVASVLKGRANYACRQRLAELADTGAEAALFDERPTGAAGAQIPRLVRWAAGTTSGDRAELGFEPLPAAWSAISVTSRECPGAGQCARGAECFAEQARWRAAASTIIVVNLHLYTLDLAARGGLLPEHDAVIIDEAHQLEDVVSSTTGIELTPGRFAALARAARGLVPDSRAAADVAELATSLGRDLGDHIGHRLRRPEVELGPMLELAHGRLERLRADVDRDDGPPSAPRLRLLTGLGALVDEIQALMDMSDDAVAWVEGRPHEPVLRSAPLDVGPFLAEHLWTERTAVLTSATLPETLPERLGLTADRFDRRDFDSPFDYGVNGLLYCALHLPEPRSGEFDEAAATELATLVDAAGGRTLGLFTSWRAVDTIAPLLSEQVAFPVLTQRDLPKPALIERFVSDEETVLLATMGFWQGVDVPGSALSLVVIDRIPFPRPDEPLLQARRELARGAAFRTIDLPRAAIMLAQGAGRLIRTAADRGVVAVLDRRLGTASYRWDLVRALPPMRRTRDQNEVVAFLRGLRE
jgi:ATP-dependent DNA helicase DinG